MNPRDIPSRRPLLFALIVVCIVIIAMGTVYSSIVGAYTVHQIRVGQKGTKESVAVIKDCTTQGGRCYREEQAVRRSTVDSINEVSAYAAACAQHHEGLVSIKHCIRRYLHHLPQPHLDRDGSSPITRFPTMSPPPPHASPSARPKADRGSGPEKHHPTPPPGSTTPTPPTSPGSPSPSPSSTALCVLGVVCIR